jgi:hypothetical protein
MQLQTAECGQWYLESKLYAAAVLFHKETGKKFTKQLGIN